ncbi:LysR family transcriptional regulator [Hoeflea prorocentri]|uniref:LysR family transcriptional regulator n=1 Tax=Hoeflea prorocentri TaxID=1922333 RepID=A0A9X3UL60_9HYPH|nr:LysR family transcriptional regulator [Hoeflea prorocentri]MCY6381214.1 LysR family transcriptional regulator [Hoeflea prorocentri]MDA5399014.1 LysR family transcriptional regulator [Hoeflea prorocentri]
MSEFDADKIRRLDMSVLLVFLALVRHRKALAVAEELGLTPSSISHAQKRLRDILGDPLFIRRPHGLEPTAFALELEPRIRDIVTRLQEVVSSPRPFDPKSATGTVRISAFDGEIAAHIPKLLAQMENSAPALKLIVRPFGRKDALRALEHDETDLALGFFWDLPARFMATSLYEEGYRVVMRRNHPLANEDVLGPEAFASTGHAVVSPAGDLRGIVDDSLDQMGLRRMVRVALPHFLPALATVSQSDLIATLPSRIVEDYADTFGLYHCRPPVELRSFPVSLVRHVKNQRNAMHNWVADALVGIARAEQRSAVN